MSGMDQNRIREISTEMCRILDEQSRVLNKGAKLTELSGEELEGYSHKRQRLRELSKELNELL
jgi:hypothetical protein